MPFCDILPWKKGILIKNSQRTNQEFLKKMHVSTPIFILLNTSKIKFFITKKKSDEKIFRKKKTIEALLLWLLKFLLVDLKKRLLWVKIDTTIKSSRKLSFITAPLHNITFLVKKNRTISYHKIQYTQKIFNYRKSWKLKYIQ